MRDPNNVFHLAIPCRDLEEAKAFYVGKLGCALARQYDDRITLNFFGDQVVCHLSPEKIDPKPELYPRHFGVTFRERQVFDETLRRVRDSGLKFIQEPQLRFEGMTEEHLTCFLKDPSNNVLEFKYYFEPSMMY